MTNIKVDKTILGRNESVLDTNFSFFSRINATPDFTIEDFFQLYEELFWYSQIIYGIFLIFAVVIISMLHKYSLLCSIIIAFAANYVNFFAFSKIISMRNSGVFDMIAE
jgi:hypothetical protein